MTLFQHTKKKIIVFSGVCTNGIYTYMYIYSIYIVYFIYITIIYAIIFIFPSDGIWLPGKAHIWQELMILPKNSGVLYIIANYINLK